LLTNLAGCGVIRGIICGGQELPPVEEAEGPYAGRMLSKAELLGVLNRRARAAGEVVRAPQMVIDVDLPGRFKDRINGVLVAAKQADETRREPLLFLRGDTDGGSFGFGSNAEEFWFFDEISLKKAYFGRWKYLGKPCAGRLPLDPVQITGLLGFFETSDDPARGRFISVTFSPPEFNTPGNAASGVRAGTGRYVLHYLAPRDPSRPELGSVVEREVELTAANLRPVRTVFYDRDGRQLLRAETREFYELDGKMIPKLIAVIRPVYRSAPPEEGKPKPPPSTEVEKVEQFNFVLSELDFTRGKNKEGKELPPGVFQRLFEPDPEKNAGRGVPYYDTREYIDKRCETLDAPTAPAGGGEK
jgi:hypothetical protein